jgi:hypothetical protein
VADDALEAISFRMTVVSSGDTEESDGLHARSHMMTAFAWPVARHGNKIDGRRLYKGTRLIDEADYGVTRTEAGH